MHLDYFYNNKRVYFCFLRKGTEGNRTEGKKEGGGRKEEG